MASFNLVLYDHKTTLGGSLKERWGMSYTIGITLSIVIIFFCKYIDILNSINLATMDTWDRYPDNNTIISAILEPQGLKLSKPKYSF